MIWKAADRSTIQTGITGQGKPFTNHQQNLLGILLTYILHFIVQFISD